MPSGLDSSGTASYRPTSLDFINLPNPIEPTQPQPGSQKHPLNGTPPLENARPGATTNQDLFRLILDPAAERPAKRQKPSDSNLLDLPKLPVRNATKRLRIPPTLSGLHQPPPDAGLLPSISVEQPQASRPKPQDQTSQTTLSKAVEKQETSQPDVSAKAKTLSAPSERPVNVQKKLLKRNKWTDEETECLLKGVSQFGIGNWTKILKCPDYSFHNRTAIDLKDRFRVCCPDKYKCVGHSKATSSAASQGEMQSSPKPKTSTKGPPSERISSSKLKEMGIIEPFSKTTRRIRHGYTKEEDDALLRGYKKYGNSWAKIRQDSSLDLSHRRAPDLRDRFRTKFPDEYAKVSAKVRPSQATAGPQVTSDAPEVPTTSEGDTVLEPPKVIAPLTTFAVSEGAEKEDSAVNKSSTSRKTDQRSLFSLDDLFLGVPFGTEDNDSEPIVLDRGILDWATGDAGKNTLPDPTRSHGIDPLMTLKLPKPISTMPTTVSTAPVAGPPPNTAPALPSLATLLPEMATPEPLELPSLMQWFSSAENDARGSGGTTIPTLEELLSG